MFILQETASRAEYKRRWQILHNAEKKGLNAGLVSAFYEKMTAQGYEQETIRAALYYAARNGVFGLMTTRAR